MKGFQIHGWRGGIGTSLSPEYPDSSFEQLHLPLGDLIGMDVELLGQFGQRLLRKAYRLVYRDHSAKRRVIAPCPAPSRFAESSATMAGSAITLQSPRGT